MAFYDDGHVVLKPNQTIGSDSTYKEMQIAGEIAGKYKLWIEDYQFPKLAFISNENTYVMWKDSRSLTKNTANSLCGRMAICAFKMIKTMCFGVPTQRVEPMPLARVCT